MFGGVAHSSPPENRLAVNDVIQPGMTNLSRGNVLGVTVIFQSSDEGKGSRNIIVRDNQGNV